MNALQSVSIHVADNFDTYMKKGKWWTGIYKKIPSGCSINDNGRPFYENSSSGLGTGREDLTPVCHNSLNSGNVNSCFPMSN